jgi:large subunit ribosomal protein L3
MAKVNGTGSSTANCCTVEGGLFAQKVGMAQVFDVQGKVVPVTKLRVGVCQVLQIKTFDTDGYNAIQVGYNEDKNIFRTASGISDGLSSKSTFVGYYGQKKCNMPMYGHLRKSGYRTFKNSGEFRVSNPNNFFVGQLLKPQMLFTAGKRVTVTGKTIGKGFTGNQKRNGFSRGPQTHGSKNHRLPGSIGAGSTPGRVLPGKKMAGRHGNQIVTIKGVRVLGVYDRLGNEPLVCDGLIVLGGSVPGKRQGFLKIAA